MSVDVKKLAEAIENAKKSSKKRRFVQSIDLIVNLKDIDLRRPENRINELVELPNPVNKPTKVCVIASGAMALDAKKANADLVISPEELEALGQDRKKAKKIAKEHDVFLAEASLMPLVGKSMGAVLGPRGKMPVPVPPNAPIQPMIEKHRRVVRIRTRDQPVVQCRVGTEDMDSTKVAENAMAVISRLEEKLEKGFKNIASVYVKTTMGPAVKVFP